jgi:hypothetical protein
MPNQAPPKRCFAGGGGPRRAANQEEARNPEFAVFL